jgi:RNA polymerase sigma-70 factor (ECF subfamily)
MDSHAEGAEAAHEDHEPEGLVAGRAVASGAVTVERLIELHHRAVFRYAYRLTGTVADAEDLTQQTFLIAQQKVHQVREPDKAIRWLFAVVRSSFLKNRRRRRPVPATTLELEIDEVLAAPPHDEPIDRQALDAACAALPDPFRVILAMYYFDELSYKEIAEELELPIGTVMSRLARAKQRLRQMLTPSDMVRRRE